MEASRISRSILAAVLSVMTVLVVGYLSVQIEGITKGYLVGFEGTPTMAIAKRFPWELQVAAVLVALAAFAGYRRLADSRMTRIVVLVPLIATAIIAGALWGPFQTIQPPLIAVSLLYGGTSAFTLALIGGVIADLVLTRNKVPEVAGATEL